MEKSSDGASPPPLPSVPRHLRRDFDSKHTQSAPSSPNTDVRRSLTMPRSPPTPDAFSPTRSLSYGNLRRRESPTPRLPGGIGDPSSPSPRRNDRVAEFPNGSPSSGGIADSSTQGRRQSSPLHSPQLRRRKLRSSIGSSDLTKARPLVARRVDDGDSEGSGGGNDIDGDRDHFIVDTEMAFRRESNNDVRCDDDVRAWLLPGFYFFLLIDSTQSI